jgi:hypothetical protein
MQDRTDSPGQRSTQNALVIDRDRPDPGIAREKPIDRVPADPVNIKSPLVEGSRGRNSHDHVADLAKFDNQRFPTESDAGLCSRLVAGQMMLRRINSTWLRMNGVGHGVSSPLHRAIRRADFVPRAYRSSWLLNRDLASCFSISAALWQSADASFSPSTQRRLPVRSVSRLLIGCGCVVGEPVF